MIDGKRVLGLCVSKIQDRIRNEVVDLIYDEVRTKGMKLIVYNSIVDNINMDSSDEITSSVYNLINFDVLDCLIIYYESFKNKTFIEAIAQKARKNNTPVIVIKGQLEGCYNITINGNDSFHKLIHHVIAEHNVTDTIFMAGKRNEQFSQERLLIYKEELENAGLPFSEDNVYYGEFWEHPTKEIIDEIIEVNKLPKAIICANDYMAIAVCEELVLKGYRVPEDVIVTGYDGVLLSSVFKPHITTCVEDFKELATVCVKKCIEAMDKTMPPHNYEIKNSLRISESCGCKHISDEISHQFLVDMIKESDFMELYDYDIFLWNNRISEVNDISLFLSFIARKIDRNAYICVNKDLLDYPNKMTFDNMSMDSDESVLIPSLCGIDYKNNVENEMISVSDVVFSPHEWVKDDSMYVITMINSGKEAWGYYAFKTCAFREESCFYNRTAQTISSAFNSIISKLKQISFKFDSEEATFYNPITKLPNIKGAQKWFENFKAVPENVEKQIAVSVYALPKYKYIYEKFGINEIESSVKFVAESLKDANERDCYIAHISEDEFMIINYAIDGNVIGNLINNATREFFENIEYFNSIMNKEYYLEVNCGCYVANPGWNSKLMDYISLAKNEMYLNRLDMKNSGVIKESGPENDSDIAHNSYNDLKLLIDKNQFVYHFQPIVNARTGEIYAYEALMRSSGGIKLTPLQILDIAEAYNLLYDIEKATLFNVMDFYANNYEAFEGRKVFINTIPGHFLFDEDSALLKEKYYDYLDNFVFEITEQDSISDGEVNKIRSIAKADTEASVAVDDYGAGHSNIVNLFRYNPQIIKVDRFLISGIESDTNKQLFVKNTVEFATQNNISVLAEGVETYEELITVIECGVDYIQGYYTGRPAPTPLDYIDRNIHDEIVKESVKLSKYNNNLLSYTAQSGEVINVIELAAKKITSIDVPDGRYLFVGDDNNTVDIIINVLENAKVDITLSNVNIKGSSSPTINLGSGSVATITVDGDNTLNKEGIYVHPTAKLVIKGQGNLTVNNNRNHSVGIGANFDEPFGTIQFACDGSITVNASGEKVVGIGGSDSTGEGISFIKGNYKITGRGINVIGIGSSSGNSSIRVDENAKLTVNCNGNEAVSVGTLYGQTTIITSGSMRVITDGEHVTGIGTKNGSAYVSLEAGTVDSIVHCDHGVCIGTYKGKANVKNISADLTVYGEGNSVVGIGGMFGECNVLVKGGYSTVELLCADKFPFGRDDTQARLTGGTVKFVKKMNHHAIVEGGTLLMD